MIRRIGGWMIVAMAFILMVLVDENTAQVTFSRDWNAGKRNPAQILQETTNDCRASVRNAATICRMLLNEVRQVAACEASRSAEEDSSSSGLFSSAR